MTAFDIQQIAGIFLAFLAGIALLDQVLPDKEEVKQNERLDDTTTRNTHTNFYDMDTIRKHRKLS